MNIEIIMAEFGGNRSNAGDSALPTERSEPTLSSFLKHFPEAKAIVYTDQDWKSTERCEVYKVEQPLFDKLHPRYGWRCNDYYQVWGLLRSKADIAIALDSDLLIVDERVRSIIPLTRRFGLCMPVNGRNLVWRDARSDCDGGKVADESQGMGMCHCTAFWSFLTQSEGHRELLTRYCLQIRADAKNNNGARGPLSLWRAIWDSGISPYTLPVQWCVTASNMGLIGNVILHVGHEGVATQYADLIKEWTP